MKKIIAIVITGFFCIPVIAQDIYSAGNVKVSFFSETPIENIDATSIQALGAINIEKLDVFFRIPIRTFTFKNGQMQEHFNENYMETDKEVKDSAGVVSYPNKFALFKGKINETVDLTKDTTWNVTVTGTLTIHGVEQPRTISGVIERKDGYLIVTSEFDVKVAEHEIKVPQVVLQKIAEVIHVKLRGLLSKIEK